MTEPTQGWEPTAKYQRDLEPGGELEELNRLRAWREHHQREAEAQQLQAHHQQRALEEQQRRIAEQQHQLYQQQRMAEQQRHMYQAPPPPPQQFAPIQQVIVNNSVQNRSAFPHTLHLILTLVTCGAWLPVWIIHAIIVAVRN